MAKAPRKRAAAPKKAGAKSPKAKSPKAKKSPAKRSTPRKSSAPAPKAAKGGYEVICSECYSEFDFNPGTSASQITCPVCMHVGEVAESTERNRFGSAKSSERSKFLAGLIPGMLMLGVGAYWISKLNGTEELGSGMNYGLLGATGVLFIITVFASAKYEGARQEVYF